MPSLEEATRPVDTSQMETIDFASRGGAAPSGDADYQQRSSFLRSPLPRIDATPDALRQFYQRGVPQFRSVPPPAPVTSGIQGATGATGAAGQTIVQQEKAKNSRVIITQTVTFPNSTQATGTFPLGRTCGVMQVTVPAACRLRLYSSTAARDADKSRGPDPFPIAFTAHGLILDLNLDSSFTFPQVWKFSPELFGSDLNGSSTGNIAYTVDNYGTVTGSGWTTITPTAPPPSGDDPSNTFGDSYNQWVAPTIGSLIEVTSSSFYNTQAWFLDAAFNRVAGIGNTSTGIPAGTTVQAVVPFYAAYIRGYAQSGHFADIGESAQVAGSVVVPSITFTFVDLVEENA